MDLVQRLDAGLGGFLLFGLTPPKLATGAEDLQRIADVTLARLRDLDPDGVVLYDIAEEQDRNPSARPFPFLQTHDPSDYLADHLSGWHKPAIVYRSVGKYPAPQLRTWLGGQAVDRLASVLVGASSSTNPGLTSLREAYGLRAQARPDLLAGAVVIPERHTARGDEHRRMLNKQDLGATFFVSQVLYDAGAAMNLVADYRDECDARGLAPKPVVFTLSVCGSVRTLEFLSWLGVEVPRWLQRDLRRTDDTLAVSVEHSLAVATEVVGYCHRVGVPVGLNVESVSTRRVEIDAAVQLAADLRPLLRP